MFVVAFYFPFSLTLVFAIHIIETRIAGYIFNLCLEVMAFFFATILTKQQDDDFSTKISAHTTMEATYQNQ